MSKLPDIYCEPGDDGYVTVVANKKARRFLRKCFGGDPPRWNRVEGSDILRSPEYRSVGIGNGPVPQMMLAHCHQSGLTAWFTCCNCDALHIMDDAMAPRFVEEAAAVGTPCGPNGETLQ